MDRRAHAVTENSPDAAPRLLRRVMMPLLALSLGGIFFQRVVLAGRVHARRNRIHSAASPKRAQFAENHAAQRNVSILPQTRWEPCYARHGVVPVPAATVLLMASMTQTGLGPSSWSSSLIRS
jgi:hypothetical protein